MKQRPKNPALRTMWLRGTHGDAAHRGLSLAAIAIACALLGACEPREGPADENDLRRARTDYAGAQQLIIARLGRSDVTFPALEWGEIYEDNIGFEFFHDSLSLRRIDSSAFLQGYYGIAGAPGGEFVVDMKRDTTGIWRPLTDSSVNIFAYSR